MSIKVEIKGIDASAMESLIQFAYSGRISIHPSNAHSLMIGASYLQLNQVRDACADYFKQRLDCSNGNHEKFITHTYIHEIKYQFDFFFFSFESKVIC